MCIRDRYQRRVRALTDIELTKLQSIPSMGCGGCDTPTAAHWRRAMLARVILVAMLHDVNDHKYDDAEGSLTKSVEAHIDTILEAHGGLLEVPSETTQSATFPPLSRTAVLDTMSAISFSKENKKGMRYYTDSLGPNWTLIRDVVSDADKLEAIGESGLVRCWEFGLTSHCPPGKSGAIDSSADVDRTQRQAQLLQRVKDHADEKLFLLTSNFMSTPTGRFLGSGRDDDMKALLEKWSSDSTLLPPM
eukprot:TRINITY_DN18889_c0_g1_i1.p1 TRINITY_DN18889_c0_g1~~TRINITY_DN18889_c0_g1_i1.p1  ORF type:complete len:247 (-),score=27.58 TRINITY_DN18889_c0_g1_i1:190-930(-)